MMPLGDCGQAQIESIRLSRSFASHAWQYGTRIAPALSVCGLMLLLTCSIFSESPRTTASTDAPMQATIWQILMSCYLCILSVLSAAFPARAFWALDHVIQETRLTAFRMRSRVDSSLDRRDSGFSESDEPLFVIVIPAYKESRETLEDTLQVLSSHSQARTRYHVYLAMEEREKDADVKARTLSDQFRGDFGRITYCIHPYGLPGEVPGKSSNQSWAVNQASQYYDEQTKKNIIVTVMDADTHLLSQYFDQIAERHTNASHTTRDRTIYLPSLIFDRNIARVPLFVRLADMMWAGAGISSMYSGSTVCIPTSVYSIPMPLVEYVGGWDVGAGAIGEDMHMYLKCFFALAGNLKAQTIFAPASSCDICSPRQGVEGYVHCLWLRYQQAKRHMWGMLDTGYAIRGLVSMITRTRRLHAASGKEGLDAAAAQPQDNPIISINKTTTATLCFRMFEAHLLPAHFGLTLAVASACSFLLGESFTPPILRMALTVANYCRTAGFLFMICYFYRYLEYHRVCIEMRRKERENIVKLKPTSDSSTETDLDFSPQIFLNAGVAEACLFPLAGIMFGVLPALQAMISHIFTDRLTYVVSLKTAAQKLCPTVTETMAQRRFKEKDNRRTISHSWAWGFLVLTDGRSPLLSSIEHWANLAHKALN